ncbi:hypothetical protein CPB86DRAFT_878681 [Serendipita vermifera]|nr:hypothetical protein CPB86DRAFT_878681 [Serendipita vermifera]
MVANIYLDNSYLDPSSPSFANSGPVYTFDKTAICDGDADGLPGFRTASKLLSSPQGKLTVSTIQRYPFDVYFAIFGIKALDNTTGASIPMNITRSFGVAANFDVELQQSTMFGVTRPALGVTLQSAYLLILVLYRRIKQAYKTLPSSVESLRPDNEDSETAQEPQ